ncbi:hypothetical protein VCHE16_0629 [Vibrio paracholerae HE-16]|nr:hypothetical protein VCHE09_0601 [Vibrio paracholerae HE-09]EKG89906.1 hypothetical protein VCHE16_0629 [Vibrio paracholerae HE-16]EMP94015.1 hypothetical protein VC87395_000672 [Vibrio paracholerae 87395]
MASAFNSLKHRGYRLQRKGIAIVTKATKVCLNAFAIGYE